MVRSEHMESLIIGYKVLVSKKGIPTHGNENLHLCADCIDIIKALILNLESIDSTKERVL